VLSTDLAEMHLGSRPARARAASGGRLVVAVLGVLCLAEIGVLVVLGDRLTFFNDDWWFLLQRPGIESHGGLDTLLAPHNSNSVLLPAIAYKVLVAVFGLGSQLPFRLLLGLMIVAVGVGVFAVVRSRLGDVVALACAAVILFLGPAWEDLLFFASIDLIGSVAAGVGALWALDRDSPRRNALACGLLACSAAFSNVGVPFALAAAVAVLLRRRLSQLWLAAVPLGLFAIWWVAYGSGEPSHLSGSNVSHLPYYVLKSAAAGFASLAGVSAGPSRATYWRGGILLAVGAVVVGVALVRGWRPRTAALVPLVGLVGFWLLTGSSFIVGREAFASRYQLIDVVLLLLVVVEAVGPVRVGRTAATVVGIVAVAVIASNVGRQLTYGYRFMRTQSGFVKADLAALELGRRWASPNLWLLQPVAHNPYLSGVTAGRYFAETDAHGRPPVYSISKLQTAPSDQRQAADSVLAAAERLAPVRFGAGAPTGGCTRLTGGTELTLRPGALRLANVGTAGLAVGVRRFAPEGLVTYVALMAPGWKDWLTVPDDGVSVPWRLSSKAAHGASAVLAVCPA
jgi:hypothetical protein